jgi:hypothetical protein
VAQYADRKKGPILLGALCPRTVARGTLVQLGLPPTGYKWMRRVPHSAQGLRLGNHRKRKNQRYSDSWQALLLLGARFRRQPLAPEGATLTGKRGLTAQRGQAEGAAVAMNAEMRSQ